MDKIDIVVTFYKKWRTLPMLLWGLDANKDYINKVIIANDELWEKDRVSKLLSPYADTLKFDLIEHEHDGWGAAKCINEGVDRVSTNLFLHIDGDMVLPRGSLKDTLSSPTYVNELKACKIIDVSDDAFIRGDRANWVVVASLENTGDRRDISGFRSPMPLNLRHGHYLASTSAFKQLGGQSLDFNNTYFSMDYHLAARWMLAYGRDSFSYGGGVAYHVGGIYTSPCPDMESDANKAKVQEMLDAYCDVYKDEVIEKKWSAT